MAEQVLIEFVGDTSKLQPAVDILAKTGQITDKDAAAFKNLSTQSNNAFKGVTSTSKSAIKSLDDVGKSAKKLATTFEDEIAAGMQDALDEAGVTVEEFNEKLKESGFVIDDVADSTKNLDTSQQSLKKQLRGINDELAQMKLRGQTNTAQYQELREKAGELKDTIADVSEEVARAGSDTRGFDNLLQLASGVTAGFAVAQGSMALFGEEGEEIQKTLLKVNAAMAILQGFQQLQAIAAQKNFQSLTALIGIEKIQTLQTTLQTAAESRNIIVRNAAIISQKALNAVLTANPIFLVVAAVAALAAAWAIFASNAQKAADAQVALNTTLAEGGELLESSLQSLTSQTERQIALSKLQGKNTNDQIQIEAAAANERLRLILQAQIATDNALNDENLKRRLSADEYKKLQDQKEKLDNQFYVEHAALETKKLDFDKKRLDDSIKSYQAYQDAKVAAAQKGSIAELEAQINAVKTAAETTKKLNPDLTSGELAKLAAETSKQVIDLQNQIRIKILENEKSLFEAKLATIKEGSIAELEEQKKIAAKETEIQLAQLGISNEKKKALAAEGIQQQLELDRQIHDRQLQEDLNVINTRAAAAKQGSIDEFSAKLDALRKQNEIDLNGKGVTDAKKLELEALYQKAVLDLTKTFNAQTQTETINTKQAQINQRLADLQKLSVSQNNKELLQLKKDSVEEQAQLDIVSAQATITNEKLKAETILAIRKKANADKLAIDQQAALEEINFQTDISNTLIELEKKRLVVQADKQGFNFRARAQATKDLQKLTIEQIDNEEDALEKKRAKGLINEEDYNKDYLAIQGKRIDTELAAEEQKEKIKQQIIGAGFQILNDGVNNFFDNQATRRQADLDNEIAALEARKTAEIDNKNLTEGQKAEIDRKFQARENALKLKAFNADKQAKKQQAIISGALAVVNALATAPTIIAGLILAGVVAIDTAFQISKINAAQPPAFKKGTRNAPKGYKWVGEEGPELTWSKGGEVIYTHKQSMTIADAWRGGSLAHADDILRNSIASPNQEVLSNISINNAGNLVLDYDAMGQAIADHMPAPNIVQNNIDANGLTSYVMKSGSRMQQLNKRYTVE